MPITHFNFSELDFGVVVSCNLLTSSLAEGLGSVTQRLHLHLDRAKGDAPKVTEANLRFPAVFCENLRFSAKTCALQMLEFPGEGVNLRKSAVFCENLRFARSLSP